MQTPSLNVSFNGNNAGGMLQSGESDMDKDITLLSCSDWELEKLSKN